MEVAGLYDCVPLQGVVAVLDEGVILFVGHGLEGISKDGFVFLWFVRCWRFVWRFQVVEKG